MTESSEAVFQLSTSDIIAITAVVVTLVVGVVSWIVSASLARRSMKRMEIQYRLRMTPLLDKSRFREANQITMSYQDEVIDELVLLEVDIINSGNVAIESPPLKIESRDATYIIPAYIDDIPDGYDTFWEFEREDGETCLIKANHINPGQVLKARFLMDQMPSGEPIFTCPMPNLKLRRSNNIEISPLANKLLEVMYPTLASAIKITIK
ncbi:hypothetical protein [Aliidiomarina indica]|uniref:hypothetical protein n=1 Tax=Aliidiomarina indica TaxID=2749147 RepID=UPI00188FEAA9|nr:hypothetical protein [Aliidiomarina indica]